MLLIHCFGVWDEERYRMECLNYWFLRSDPQSSSQYNCSQSYQNLSNTQDRRADYEARGLRSSWVWVPVLSLTGSDNFKQFTSLTFLLLQGQRTMMTESAFRLLVDQHLLGSQHMHALLYGLAHLDVTSAPWFGIIHFTDERNWGSERWINLLTVIWFTKLAQLFLLIKCSLRNHLLKRQLHIVLPQLQLAYSNFSVIISLYYNYMEYKHMIL